MALASLLLTTDNVLHDIFLTQKRSTKSCSQKEYRNFFPHSWSRRLISNCPLSRISSFLPHKAAQSAGGLQGFVIHGDKARLPPTTFLLLVWPAGATQNEFTPFPIWRHYGVGSGQLSGLLSGISLHRFWKCPSCDMISGTTHESSVLPGLPTTLSVSSLQISVPPYHQHLQMEEVQVLKIEAFESKHGHTIV